MQVMTMFVLRHENKGKATKQRQGVQPSVQLALPHGHKERAKNEDTGPAVTCQMTALAPMVDIA